MPSADRGAVEKAMAFDIDKVVARYARDQKLSMNDAREHERELKRYLALVASNPGVVYGMCGPIDELWHRFITFTLLYESFCQSVAQRFIHHFPNENVGEKEDSEERRAQYERFRRDYKETYREDPPQHLWPYAMEAKAAVLGCSTCYCCIAVA
jgi:hypothetical protein